MSFISGMSRRKQITYGILLVYVVGLVVLGAVYGLHTHKNTTYNIVSPYHLTSWVHLFGPIEIDKGVFYLLLTAALTIGILVAVSRSMQMRPNRVQVAVEWLYDLTTRLTNDNMDDQMAKKWFPLIFTLFVFVLVTNLLGYIPLPVNTGDKIDIAGVHLPSFQIYATDTNVALPLVLALTVFVAYNVEGVRHHGFGGYIKSLVPAGVGGGMLLILYPLEIVSHFLRLLSLTIRLWANLLAGHLLIDFMAGGMAVLLGLPALGWFLLPMGVAIYLFECVLIASLQAFIFAILTAIYLGGAVESH
ncbi:MAG TPA: F0F1 ATP synthase subunit A [Acidimicrobiales bacterium]|nr:F0F1 ATP synthase subunit A [Acidimicrobiales bacterium]